jgi:hypothetical protein
MPIYQKNVQKKLRQQKIAIEEKHKLVHDSLSETFSIIDYCCSSGINLRQEQENSKKLAIHLVHQ